MTNLNFLHRPTLAWGGGVLVVLAVLAVFLMPAARAPAEDDAVLARVNGVEIKASDLAVAEEEIGAQLAQVPAEAKLEQLVSYLTDMLLLTQAAEKQNVAESDEFKRRLAHLRKKLLMETLLQQETKAAVTDASMHKVYDDAVKQMGGEKEVRARHILVATEEEAKAIVEDLKKGGDFAEIAKQKSKDTSAAQGGDLDYFTKSQMVPEFAEAAFKMEKGQVSEPVKTQFGWHVIKVEDMRDKQPPPFESVKGQIETYLTRKAQAEFVAKLRQDAKIERLDAKPAAPEKK
jgi:peptidyl-prolyl cis-trans isomerase C